jgi:hypothetical protein
VGVKTNEIYSRMGVLYGDNCLNQRKVYEWSERLGKRVYKCCQVCTFWKHAEVVNDQLEQLIRNSRRISINKVVASEIYFFIFIFIIIIIIIITII